MNGFGAPERMKLGAVMSLLRLLISKITSRSGVTALRHNRTLEPITDLVSHHGGHRDAARLGDALDTRCNIDAIVIDVTVVEGDVAHVHPDAELNPPLFRPLLRAAC